MLKSNFPRATKTHLNFHNETHPPMGIWFEKRDGTKHYAPYSFLSAVDLEKRGLIFHYSHATVTVQGTQLGELCDFIARGSLAVLREDEPGTSENSFTVSEITIEERD